MANIDEKNNKVVEYLRNSDSAQVLEFFANKLSELISTKPENDEMQIGWNDEMRIGWNTAMSAISNVLKAYSKEIREFPKT